MKTRDRIVTAALQLFNEQGTRAVSTNHIAAAVGISPGNLYHHFRNKEDIIRAIFEEMDAYGLAQYQEVLDTYPPGSVASMQNTFVMIQSFNWRYRFFKRELSALIMNDQILRERFHRTHHGMLAMIRRSNEQAIAGGVLRSMTESEKALFSESIWMMALFWLNYLEIGGEDVNEKTLARGEQLLLNMIVPYLTEAALRELEKRSPNEA